MITNYVKWVAQSMGISLSNTDVDNIVLRLLDSEKYKDMLHELEGFIMEGK